MYAAPLEYIRVLPDLGVVERLCATPCACPRKRLMTATPEGAGRPSLTGAARLFLGGGLFD